MVEGNVGTMHTPLAGSFSANVRRPALPPNFIKLETRNELDNYRLLCTVYLRPIRIHLAFESVIILIDVGALAMLLYITLCCWLAAHVKYCLTYIRLILCIIYTTPLSNIIAHLLLSITYAVQRRSASWCIWWKSPVRNIQ